MEFSQLRKAGGAVLKRKDELAFPILFSKVKINPTFSMGKLLIYELLFLILTKLVNIRSLRAIRVAQLKTGVYSADARTLWIMKMYGILWIKCLRTQDKEVQDMVRVNKAKHINLDRVKIVDDRKPLERQKIGYSRCDICEAICGTSYPLDDGRRDRFMRHVCREHIGLSEPPDPLHCPRHGEVYPKLKNISTSRNVVLALGVTCKCDSQIKLEVTSALGEKKLPKKKLMLFIELKDWVPLVPNLQRELNSITDALDEELRGLLPLGSTEEIITNSEDEDMTGMNQDELPDLDGDKCDVLLEVEGGNTMTDIRTSTTSVSPSEYRPSEMSPSDENMQPVAAVSSSPPDAPAVPTAPPAAPPAHTSSRSSALDLHMEAVPNCSRIDRLSTPEFFADTSASLPKSCVRSQNSPPKNLQAPLVVGLAARSNLGDASQDSRLQELYRQKDFAPTLVQDLDAVAGPDLSPQDGMDLRKNPFSNTTWDLIEKE